MSILLTPGQAGGNPQLLALLDAIRVSESGPGPQALQETWAATATEWIPANPWRLRPGPSIVVVLALADDFSAATCELWQPVEPT